MKESIDKAIAYFEKDSASKVKTITEISGGTGNDLFLVNFRHIVRIKKPNLTDEEFNTPVSEATAIVAAQQVKGSPLVPINNFDVRTGNKIEVAILDTEPLVSPLSLVTKVNLRRVIDAIKVLHQGRAKTLFRNKDRFYSYKKKSGEKLPTGFEKRVLTTAFHIFENEPIVLSHNDLWSGNILLSESGGPVYLIDFEFAAGNADIFDLASLLEENEIDEALCMDAVAYYYQSDDPSYYERVEAVMLYLDALWFYWATARYKETGNEEFAKIASSKKARFLRAFESSL